MFLRSIQLDGLLSFAPGSEPFELQPLNVVIGPNGSGKSNLIEAIELLHALPTSLANAIREGGGIREWLWKDGAPPWEQPRTASIEAVFSRMQKPALRYRFDFNANEDRAVVMNEKLDDEGTSNTANPFHYRFSGDLGELTSSTAPGSTVIRFGQLNTHESIFTQRKDPDRYPELTWLAAKLSNIQTFREWKFGRHAPVRQPQPVDLPSEVLASDVANLALLVERLIKNHDTDTDRLRSAMQRFLPRFTDFSVERFGNLIQLAIREEISTTSAARLSDGTLRFISLAVLLLQPEPPPLICIEEPELGLHPDALSIIAELLVEASTRTQLIVTTHSDALVSALSAHVESVVVCEHRGGTVLSRLEAEKLSHWLDKYRLGDLWRMGELGGNP